MVSKGLIFVIPGCTSWPRTIGRDRFAGVRKRHSIGQGRNARSAVARHLGFLYKPVASSIIRRGRHERIAYLAFAAASRPADVQKLPAETRDLEQARPRATGAVRVAEQSRRTLRRGVR